MIDDRHSIEDIYKIIIVLPTAKQTLNGQRSTLNYADTMRAGRRLWIVLLIVYSKLQWQPAHGYVLPTKGSKASATGGYCSRKSTFSSYSTSPSTELLKVKKSVASCSKLQLLRSSNSFSPLSPAKTAKTAKISNTSKTSNTQLNSTFNPIVLTAALSATAKLLSSIGIGALTSTAGPKLFGRVLDASAVSALSKLTYWLFQPCFLLCGVALTLAKASSTTQGKHVAGTTGGLPTNALLLLPLASLIQITLGAITAKIITTRKFQIRPLFLGIDNDDDASASDIQMCTTFANSGPLPLILSDALFGGALLSDVSACISFYLLVWSPLFWTAGKFILGLNTSNEHKSSSKRGLVAETFQQIKTLLSPPVIGSILGVIIGSNDVLRKCLLDSNGILAPLFGSLKTFGAAYLPAAILVLAGSLVKKSDDSTQGGPPSSKLSPKTVISILFSRFILSPLLALSTVNIMNYANLMPVDNARTMAVVTFAILMEGCQPPAQNSVIMLQLADEKDRAAKMAKLLTIVYALSTIPVTLLLGLCLGKSGILSFA